MSDKKYWTLEEIHKELSQIEPFRGIKKIKTYIKSRIITYILVREKAIARQYFINDKNKLPRDTALIILSDLDFEKKKVIRNTKYSDWIFTGNADFTKVQFSAYGKADFKGARFTRDADFRRAQFSESADFRRVQFSESADFKGARFSGIAYFSKARFRLTSFTEAKFSSFADFTGAQFSRNAYFEEVRFSGGAYFIKALFSEKADFREVQFFEKADFTGAYFSWDANFIRAQFSESADFREVQFSEKSDFTGAQFFWDVKFTGANFKSDVNFSEVIFKKKIIISFDTIKSMNFPYIESAALLKNHFQEYGDFHFSDEFYVKQMDIIRKEKGFLNKYIWGPLWWLTSRYGTSITRWIVTSCLIAIAFGVFFHCSPEMFATENWDVWRTSFELSLIGKPVSISIEPFYFSIVTFTTLGFGDFTPKNDWGQFWVTVEVIIGYIMLGGLITILSNKLIRK